MTCRKPWPDLSPRIEEIRKADHQVIKMSRLWPSRQDVGDQPVRHPATVVVVCSTVLQRLANQTAIPTGSAAVDVVARYVLGVPANLLGDESNGDCRNIAPGLRKAALDQQKLQLQRKAQASRG